jgi:predicted  nucleic acid-binding Zn-ribbon protein
MANEKELKERLKVVEGNNTGLIKQVKELEEVNKKFSSENETNKGLADQLKSANDKVKTLTGQNETLAKTAGKVTGKFPKINDFGKKTVIGEVQLDEKSKVTMYRCETGKCGIMQLTVTSKEGKGESAFLTPLK